MPIVRFVNDEVEAEVESGSTLSTAAFEAGASLSFGCRAGTCGTCAVTVVSGASELDPLGFVEDDTLHVLGLAGSGRRLGCQIILRKGDLAVSW